MAAMKLLVLDIETSPHVSHTWGLFNQNVGLSQLMEPSRTICFAAKWYQKKQVKFFSEFHDSRPAMIEAAHKLLDEADAVLTYNGDKFDLPNLNKEFLLAGFTPPAPHKSIDLLKTVRRRFRFASNKLAHITVELGLEGKVPHEGHGLWVRCLSGDPQAWAHMKRYNIGDVRQLEEAYDKLLPWIAGHPSAGLYVEQDGLCPNCGSGELERRGFATTNVGKFQRFCCRGCGAWSRDSRRSFAVSIQGVR